MDRGSHCEVLQFRARRHRYLLRLQGLQQGVVVLLGVIENRIFRVEHDKVI